MAKRSGYSRTYFANRRNALRTTRLATNRELTLRSVAASSGTAASGANLINVPGVSVPVPSNMRQGSIAKIASAPAAQHAKLVQQYIAGQARAAAFHAKQRNAASGGGGGGASGATATPQNNPPAPTPATPTPAPAAPAGGTYTFTPGTDPHTAYKAAVAAAQTAGNPIPRPMSASQIRTIDPNLTPAAALKLSGAGRALYGRVAGQTQPQAAAQPTSQPAAQANPVATTTAAATPVQPAAPAPAPTQPAAPAPTQAAAPATTAAQPQATPPAQAAGPAAATPSATPAKTYPDTPAGWVQEAVDIEAAKKMDSYRQAAANRGATRAAGQSGADRNSVLAAGLAEAQRFDRFRKTTAAQVATAANDRWGVISPTAGQVASQAVLDAINLNAASQGRAMASADFAAEAQARTDISNMVNSTLSNSYFDTADKSAANNDIYNTLSGNANNSTVSINDLQDQARFAAIGNHVGSPGATVRNDYNAINNSQGSAGLNAALANISTPTIQGLLDSGLISRPYPVARLQGEIKNRQAASAKLLGQQGAVQTAIVNQSAAQAGKTAQQMLAQMQTANTGLKQYTNRNFYDMPALKSAATDPVYARNGYRHQAADGQNILLDKVWRDQKLDAKPQILDDSEFQKLISSGDFIPLYRGISGNNQVSVDKWLEQFRTGDHYAGGDNWYGDGCYGGSKSDASAYATHGTHGGVLQIAIPKNAKLGDYNVIQSDMGAYASTHTRLLAAQEKKDLAANPGNATAIRNEYIEKKKSLDALTSDEGVFASFQGYDAYRGYYSNDTWIVLNRGHMAVSSRNLDKYSK